MITTIGAYIIMFSPSFAFQSNYVLQDKIDKYRNMYNNFSAFPSITQAFCSIFMCIIDKSCPNVKSVEWQTNGSPPPMYELPYYLNYCLGPSGVCLKALDIYLYCVAWFSLYKAISMNHPLST